MFYNVRYNAIEEKGHVIILGIFTPTWFGKLFRQKIYKRIYRKNICLWYDEETASEIKGALHWQFNRMERLFNIRKNKGE